MIQGQIPTAAEHSIRSEHGSWTARGRSDHDDRARGLAACTIILWPIMRALGRRMEHKAGPDPALKAEIEHLHQRLAEVEPLQARVAELEERLDFAERLLAQGKDAERLPR